MAARQVFFSDLRDDWYRGADLMARLIDQSRSGGPELVGFPAQWSILFEHFGATWSVPAPPSNYVPIISDLSIETLNSVIEAARKEGKLRLLVEGIAALDPLVADVLHKLDRRVGFAVAPTDATIQFTGWQSYGRPEILDFTRRVASAAVSRARAAVVLPCARRRPYAGSKTHRRLEKGLAGMIGGEADRIVISSLGVIPEAFWEDPVVLAYDSGVPDTYRVLRLMREFFKLARYDRVVDCLEFEPYRDCLRIIQAEGLVGDIQPGPDRKIKKLPRP